MDFRTNDRNYYYAILSVSQESQNVDANASTLAYSLTLYAGDTWFSGYTIGYRVRINGVQVAYHDNTGNQTSMSANSSKLITSGTTTVLHNDDGTKTVAVEAEIWTDNRSGLPVYLSCSGSMLLSTADLPRIPTPSALALAVSRGILWLMEQSRRLRQSLRRRISAGRFRSRSTRRFRM